MENRKLLNDLSKNNPIIRGYFISFLNQDIESLENCMMLIINHLAMDNDMLRDELVKAKQKMCPGIFWAEFVDAYKNVNSKSS